MKSQKGQSLVETALIIPILLILIFGIADLGRVFHAYLTLDHAGREAARVATIGAEDAEIRNKITGSTSSLKGKLEYDISPPGERSSGSEVTITLIYTFDFLTPIISQTIKEFDLKSSTVMRIE